MPPLGSPVVLHSIFCPRFLASVLAESYPLPSGAVCTLLARRFTHTYRVQASEATFIFRVWRKGWRTLDEIRSELLLLRHCAGRNAPVSAPIPRRDGELVTELDAPEGRRYATLFAHAPGTRLTGEASPTAFASLGRATARIHAACDSYTGPFTRRPLDAQSLLVEPLRRLGRERPERQPEIAALEKVSARLAARMDGFPREPAAYGICHGDITPGNAHLTTGGRVEVFDFDLCGPGWRAYDLASLRWEAACAGWPPAVAEAFLQGYESERRLAGWEHEALRVLEATFSITFLGLRAALAEEWGRDALSDALLDRHVSLAKAYADRL